MISLAILPCLRAGEEVGIAPAWMIEKELKDLSSFVPSRMVPRVGDADFGRPYDEAQERWKAGVTSQDEKSQC
jgi:hypothetical protein